MKISSHQGCSVIKGVFGNFAKFTEKCLCQNRLLLHETEFCPSFYCFQKFEWIFIFLKNNFSIIWLVSAKKTCDVKTQGCCSNFSANIKRI